MKSATERIAKRDVVIATVLSALGVALMYLNIVEPGDPSNPDESSWIHVGNLLPREFAIPLFLLVTVPLAWRRVAPLEAAGAAMAGLAVNVALLGTEFVRCGVLLPTAFLFAFALGSYLEKHDALRGLGLLTAPTFVAVTFELGPVTALVMAGIAAAMWGVGRVVQSRRGLAVELDARTAELRKARDERARLEVATDRARLSGELDELLHRRLGELARLADEGPTAADAATATATLVDIERESRLTLEEMRSIVGVLRDDESDATTEPQPTLTHIQALLLRAKGADARLTLEGNPRVLPPAVELSAYRIVEHLLTSVEDTPDVAVRVRFVDDALELEVSGRARRRAHAAVERARERVELHRGTLDASTRGGRADAIVRLPAVVQA